MFSRRKNLPKKLQLFRFGNTPTLPGITPLVLLTPTDAERHNLSRKLILNIYIITSQMGK